MIIVDTALRRRQENGNPLKVGVVGCGFLGGAVIRQIVERMPGMQLAGVATRTPSRAIDLLAGTGISTDGLEVGTLSQLNDRIRRGLPPVTGDVNLLCQAEAVEVIIDASGSIETGAEIALACIENSKHLILVNAELDATVGPILYRKASEQGLVFTGTDGDQPGTQMNLLRFVRMAGMKPLVAGNIKGLQDHYRTPETQKAFATEWGQNPWMVTSFADGTKISFEQALVANATGFTVSQRGMIGMAYKGHVDELTTRYDLEFLQRHDGIIDYVVGPHPGPGVYVIAIEEDPRRQHYLKYFKMGEGPLYCFYTPYHLCHLEAPISAARAALLGDEVVSPSHGPVVDVITVAKKDLAEGETLDPIGGFMTYGVCENSDIAHRDRLLPIGLAQGCRIRRDIARDQSITWDDVEVPSDSLVLQLRRQQDELFFSRH